MYSVHIAPIMFVKEGRSINVVWGAMTVNGRGVDHMPYYVGKEGEEAC
jgi:hypothetical protein